MTKAKNVYTKAIVTLSKSKEYSAANKKKIEKLILLSTDERVASALSDAQVDVTRFNARALYAVEKCVKIVYEATRDTISASVEKNSFAAIKCAINAMREKETLTKSDIESAILVSAKVDKARAHVVYQRATKIDAVAQVQQVIDMMQTLKIAKSVARDTYEVQDTQLMQLFTEKFENLAF